MKKCVKIILGFSLIPLAFIEATLIGKYFKPCTETTVLIVVSLLIIQVVAGLLYVIKQNK